MIFTVLSTSSFETTFCRRMTSFSTGLILPLIQRVIRTRMAKQIVTRYVTTDLEERSGGLFGFLSFTTGEIAAFSFLHTKDLEMSSRNRDSILCRHSRNETATFQRCWQ